jgi:hypothetical protein
MLVVTKVDLNYQPLSDIKGRLSQFSGANIYLQKEARTLINTLVSNDRIRLLPIPTQINDSLID